MDVEQTYLKENNGAIEYEGIQFRNNSFVDFLENVVSPSIMDIDYNNELKSVAVDMTGFSLDNIKDVFDTHPKIANWRIGEISAEEIVSRRYRARFTYNSDRDLKNYNSNQTGADLVGFIEVDQDGVEFLFGEVKTSSEDRTPPGVMYSEKGMIQQLVDISCSKDKRSSLVKWIFIKCKDSKNPIVKGDIRMALTNYIKNNKVRLIGVLVRDTMSNEKDLESRSKELQKCINKCNTRAQLLAVYTNCKMKDSGWKKHIMR